MPPSCRHFPNPSPFEDSPKEGDDADNFSTKTSAADVPKRIARINSLCMATSISQHAHSIFHAFAPRLKRPFQLLWVASMATVMLSACGSLHSGGAVDKALDLVGLQRPSPTALAGSTEGAAKSALTPSRVTVRLHAGDVLNTTTDGRSLSVVARIYILRDRTSFEQVSYDALQEPDGSSSSEWVKDVVEMKEVVLTPGQKFEAVETIPSDAPYVAVVALFRAPAPRRWRFIFDTKGAAQTGLTLGIHACALSVASGFPVGSTPDSLRLAGVRCP